MEVLAHPPRGLEVLQSAGQVAGAHRQLAHELAHLGWSSGFGEASSGLAQRASASTCPAASPSRVQELRDVEIDLARRCAAVDSTVARRNDSSARGSFGSFAVSARPCARNRRATWSAATP
jgi:hypothetical protein